MTLPDPRDKALMLSAALLRFVTGEQNSSTVRITLAVDGEPVAEVDLPGHAADTITANLHGLADFTDDQTARVGEQIDAMFAETEQQRLGHWDRALIETVTLPYRTGSLETFTTPVADLELDDDDELPIPPDWNDQDLWVARPATDL